MAGTLKHGFWKVFAVPFTAPEVVGCQILRRSSTKVVAVLAQNISDAISTNEMKARKHPGRMNTKAVLLPTKLVKAAEVVLAEQEQKQVEQGAASLCNYLRSRHAPPEQEQLTQRTQAILLREGQDQNSPPMSSEEERRLNQRVSRRLRFLTYNWRPIEYTHFMGLQYLIGRTPAEFAALYRVFSEICSRMPAFQPRTLFDFGSGVGSTLWAAEEFWGSSLRERFCVDTSAEMNDLARLLLQEGSQDKEPCLKGLFFRQFLPASSALKFDLVVSSFSLLDLPSRRSRLETLENLWRKTQDFLVLTEHGTLAAFRVLMEARDFILQLDEKGSAHVFAPCPHEMWCPRLMKDHTPCNFQVAYHPFSFSKTQAAIRDTFCFVVLRRGSRSNDDPGWPRIVRETLPRHRHVVCRLCTNQGQLQEVIVTAKKHGKPLYKCARASKWGDLLPVTLSQLESLEQSASDESD